MHLHFEKTINTKSDCSILSLSWMGKVPDEIPEDGGWKLNRTNYYQEGWLATGNIRGVVGVTFTTSHCKKRIEYPLRTNYNLRGHRSEVILVKWNEPYQKLASCDSSGIIFVWIKYEGRWSIELINDRNTPVTYFSWSHDGRMALICYQDGFVLVGSVAGQRYWSSMLNLEGTITCGIWTPDDQQVYFGTTSGQIIVMDVYGAMVSQIQMSVESGITSMAWSCEKFKMEESDDNDPGVLNAGERKFALAVCLQNGIVYLMKAYDDIAPIVINTNLQGPLCMEWSNSREILAIGGVENTSTKEPGSKIEYVNVLKFFNEKGALCYSTKIPYTQAAISSITWGHNDKRLFVATGTQIHTAWISRRIATLQLLSRLKIYNLIQQETNVSLLPLPARIKNTIGNLFIQTIKCCLPEPKALREFVSQPPKDSIRLHCTMIRHDDDNNLSSGTCYTLYLEYLGGLVPLLKGKRTSKIRPEFVIFDPQEEENNWNCEPKIFGSTINLTSGHKSDTSDSERDEGCTSSPRMQRKRKERNRRSGRIPERYAPSGADSENGDLTYVDTLPEHVPLVEVTSNIWGTKFKIHGFPSMTPANLGQVTYKTSLLHLQPRQMTLVMTELRNDHPDIPNGYLKTNHSNQEDLESKPHIDLISAENLYTVAPMPEENSRTFMPSASSPVTNRSIAAVDFHERMVRNESRDASPFTFRPQASSSAIANIYLNVCHSNARQNHSNVQSTKNIKNSTLNCDVSLPTPVQSNSSISCTPNKLDEISDCDNNEEIICRLQSRDSIPKSTNGLKKRKDEDLQVDRQIPSCNIRTNLGIVDSMVRSWSVGYLDSVEAHFVPNQATLLMLRKEWPRKIVLINKKPKQKRMARQKTRQNLSNCKDVCNSQKLINCGKSKSLDSGDMFLATESLYSSKPVTKQSPQKVENEITEFVSKKNEENKSTTSTDSEKRIETPKKESSYLGFFAKRSPLLGRKKNKTQKNKSLDKTENKSEDINGINGYSTQPLTSLEKLISKLSENKEMAVLSSPKISRSSPVSPAMSKKNRRPQSASPIRKTLLSSPFLGQRKRNKLQESSDDEMTASGDENYSREHFKDLETFQKKQLRQKLKNGKIEQSGKNSKNFVPQRREFVMHNKAPMWNENSQVYQLDFGGRVTQESAKNFQIEFKGKQVMQFGRIDGNAYTLDFQYPFSALQAFSVALANVTQRLK